MARHSRPDGKDLKVALRHPLRRRVLELIETEGPLGPGQLATILCHPPGNIRYHLGVLADHGAVPRIEPEPQATGESRGERAT